MTNLREFGDVVTISEHSANGKLVPHRHAAAYAAIVLHGQYTEVSADGRIVAGPGDIIVHPVLHQHANVFASSPVSVLNLRLPTAADNILPYARLPLAELLLNHEDILRHPRGSAAAIADAFARLDQDNLPRATNDKIAFARQKLTESPASKVSCVAKLVGISAEHLAREFRVRYGLSPGEYRAEHRFRHAVRALIAGYAAADTACISGYSDQPHMIRDIKLRTGMTPRQLSRYFQSDHPFPTVR